MSLFTESTELDFDKGEHFMPTLEGASSEELERYRQLRRKYLAEKTGKSEDEVVVVD